MPEIFNFLMSALIVDEDDVVIADVTEVRFTNGRLKLVVAMSVDDEDGPEDDGERVKPPRHLKVATGG